MEHISRGGYSHGKRIWKDFEMENQNDYHDLYVQSNKYLAIDIFENFWNRCQKIHELNPACFFTAS